MAKYDRQDFSQLRKAGFTINLGTGFAQDYQKVSQRLTDHLLRPDDTTQHFFLCNTDEINIIGRILLAYAEIAPYERAAIEIDREKLDAVAKILEDKL